jgi:Pyruvate/2-oxoacid:ferredoxin oxidoreductase delta subunit
MTESVYKKLAERLDMNITGVPKKDGDFSEAFLKYLGILFTPAEAEVASHLSVDPNRLTLEEVAEKSGRPADEVEPILNGLAERGVIIGVSGQYILPILPLLVNYHPFKDRDDEDTQKAGELYQQYYIKDGFYRYYESSAAGTPQRRAIPVEQSVAGGQKVLSHEAVGHYLDEANLGAYALAPCPCRNRTEKLGIRECKDKFPIASCLFLGMHAMLMVMRGDAKQVTREEAEKYLAEMREAGLVLMADNAEEMKDGVICACCGCCCSVTRGLIKWDNPNAFERSNFVARVSDECVACGTCSDRCLFNAISVEGEKAEIDDDRCMGCGVCTVTCPTDAIRLERIERAPIYASSSKLLSKVAAENEAAGQKRPLS